MKSFEPISRLLGTSAYSQSQSFRLLSKVQGPGDYFRACSKCSALRSFAGWAGHAGYDGLVQSVAEAVEQVRATFSEKSVTAAAKVAQEAVTTFPESSDCWAMVALTDLWRGRLEEAQRAIAKARDIESSVSVLSIQAEVYAYGGQRDKALELLEQAQRLDPDHWTYLRQSSIYTIQGRSADADRLLNRALELYPEDPAVLGAKIGSLQLAGNLSAVEAFLDASPPSYHNQPGYYSARGNLAIRRRELAKAEEWLRLAVAANPEGSTPWSLLATLLSHTPRLAEAEQAANYALELNSRSPTAYMALATVARQRGDLAKADEYKRLADGAVPGVGKQERYRGATDAARKGKQSKQIKLLSKPDKNELPMHRYARLRALADALRQANRYEDLRPVIQELEGTDELSTELVRAKAALQASDSQPQEALDTLDAGLANFPDAVDLMAHRIAVLVNLGRREEAQAVAEEIAKTPLQSGQVAGMAVIQLVDAGFLVEAEALLVRAERQVPCNVLRHVRAGLDLKQGKPGALRAIQNLPSKAKRRIALKLTTAVIKALPRIVARKIKKRKDSKK